MRSRVWAESRDRRGRSSRSNVVGLGNTLLGGVTNAKDMDAGFEGIRVGLELKQPKSFGHFCGINWGLGDAAGA